MERAEAQPRVEESLPILTNEFSDISLNYTLGRRLGTGNFAKVVSGSCIRDIPRCGLKAGQQVAIKVMKKPRAGKMSNEKVSMLKSEVDIMRSIDHPNVVKLYEVYESQTKIYLVMDLLTGGELFDRIVGMGKYSEEDARYFTFKLLNAVLYLHDKTICHRDLKPENILLASKDSDAELKITDFGLSKTIAGVDQALQTRCGTPGYVAPEVLSQEIVNGELRRYGAACDMWSVGVIVYILLSAAPPFYGKTDAEMNRRIKAGQFKFPEKYWSSISAASKDFITRLLTVDPSRRMTASEALQHEWIVSIGIFTNNLFSQSTHLRHRFGEFNLERRYSGQAQTLLQDLLGLPADDEELRRFRCSHCDQLGHVIVSAHHMAFLAYDQSIMLAMPISALNTITTARYLSWSAESENSLKLQFSNDKVLQFDGFWERDDFVHLLQACGRHVDHKITVISESDSNGALVVDSKISEVSPSNSIVENKASASNQSPISEKTIETV